MAFDSAARAIFWIQLYDVSNKSNNNEKLNIHNSTNLFLAELTVVAPTIVMIAILFLATIGLTRAFIPMRLKEHSRLQLHVAVDASTVTVHVPNRVSTDKSQAILDDFILPLNEYGRRIGYGGNAQDLDPSVVVLRDDPRLAFTYGEFPTHSFDALIDLALTFLPPNSYPGPVKFIDIGSGCGRLVYHTGLTRGTEEMPWSVHGIEISEILHREALRGMNTGMEEALFTSESSPSANSIMLHLGNAEDMKHVFTECKLAFAYSTVWPCSGFSVELGAMVLHGDWSELLSQACPKGCVVITTDRALDPQYGWIIVDRLDVDNREVAGSTGYIHILR